MRVLFVLLALAAPVSDRGGFTLGEGTALSGALGGGLGVVPARIFGEIGITHALQPGLDLAVTLGGGAVTTQIITLQPTLGLRFSLARSEHHGMSILLRVGLPLSLLVADEVRASGRSTHVQAWLEGAPIDFIPAYSYLAGAHVELGVLAPLHLFPATTGELSYGAGLGLRLGIHFLSAYIIAIELTARLDHTTYAPVALGVGSGWFVIPAGQLSLTGIESTPKSPPH